MEEASKDVHYFLTTLTSAFTLFAGYQVGKSQYKISQKRKNIRQLENNEILDVEELIGKGRRVNDVVLVKVIVVGFRVILELKMDGRLKLIMDGSKSKNWLF